MPTQETIYQVADHVATITLNRPDKLNAWTAGMEQEVRAAFDQADRDENGRVFFLTGAGRGFWGSEGGQQYNPWDAARLSEKIFVFSGDSEAGDRGYQRSGGRARLGDRLVLRHALCIGCREIQHGVCATWTHR